MNESDSEIANTWIEKADHDLVILMSEKEVYVNSNSKK